MPVLKKLRWQCRRGAKELDAMLCAYLDRYYIGADSGEQQRFVELLQLEDNQLLAYFFDNRTPAEPELRSVVEKIRTCVIS